ncbi:CrcB family protein [Leucobacter allii]|uniref:Fluoride-specific ion channel FluC n=1 Tax=Leucobacter allii TaxID=2932247 RepID=A0ABY4FQ80_9MICO|nr:CrcB family protein [Leucobacter allii]UOQ58416.1 CrcB family protein [Leucobacter allii]UOR02996.1 CrcB family protein [Leucobacter allii]
MSGALLAFGIAVAGGLGAALRHLVDSGLPDRVRARFPWGILLVNLSGSLVLGILTGLALDQRILAVLATGLLGGYTTFSTASLDTVRLLLARRIGAALANGLGVLLAATALAGCGMLLGAQLRG